MSDSRSTGCKPAGERAIRLGIQLPIDAESAASSHGARHIRWTAIREMAQLAERIGLDSVWVPDHLLFRRTISESRTQGIWEGWSVVAAIAAITQHIEIGTLVMCTSFRHPAWLATMAATVDDISGGRLILGLGAGWHKPEFDAFGIAFDHRVDRFGEAIHIIRTLLKEGTCDFSGAYYQAENCRIVRRHGRSNGPPILVGSTGARMLKLTAQYADIWNAGIIDQWSSPKAIPPLRARVDLACERVGREPTSLIRTINLLVAFDLKGLNAWLPGAQPVVGTPDEMARTLSEFAAEGIAHLQLLLYPNTLRSLEMLAPVLDRLDRMMSLD